MTVIAMIRSDIMSDIMTIMNMIIVGAMVTVVTIMVMSSPVGHPWRNIRNVMSY